MKTKKQEIHGELKDHGSTKNFKEIKTAKTPKAMAEVIVRQHGDKPNPLAGKKCKKCQKIRSKCTCK